MSALYGSMHGERGEVTKCGHHNLSAHIRGWNSGIQVDAHHDKDTGDSFVIYLTSGSHGYISNQCLGKLTVDGWKPNINELDEIYNEK